MPAYTWDEIPDEPVRTTMCTTRSVLSSTRTTIGASPSQIERTTVSFSSAASRSMCGPAMRMMRSPESAVAASSTMRGPSECVPDPAS